MDRYIHFYLFIQISFKLRQRYQNNIRQDYWLLLPYYNLLNPDCLMKFDNRSKIKLRKVTNILCFSQNMIIIYICAVLLSSFFK